MTDTLIGALIAFGGTILGVLVTLGVRALDIRRQDWQARRELVGYLQMVIAEIARNRVVIAHVVEHKIDVAELNVSDSAYRSAELVLARELSAKLLSQLFTAYAAVRAGHLYSWIYVTGLNFDVQSYRRVDLQACAELVPFLLETQTALDEEVSRLNGRRWFRLPWQAPDP